MDVPCVRCGEKWDNDEIHELVEDGDYSNYDEAARAYRRKGCVVFTGRECSADRSSNIRSELYDIFGEDMDGLACDMEDFEMFL